MKQILSLLIVFLMAPVVSNASNNSIIMNLGDVTYTERVLVKELFEETQSLHSIEGEFFQTDTYSKKGKGALGFFYFQYPKKINFTYSPPNQIEIRANGRQVIIKDIKRDRNKYYPASQTPMKFLSERPEKIAFSDKVKNVFKKDGVLFVRVEQRNMFGKADITLEFDLGTRRLQGWTVHEKKNNVHVELYNLKYGNELNEDLFYIEPHKVDHN